MCIWYDEDLFRIWYINGVNFEIKSYLCHSMVAGLIYFCRIIVTLIYENEEAGDNRNRENGAHCDRNLENI